MTEYKLGQAIERIRDKNMLTFRRVEYLSEARITSIILGILSHYGWDVFDPYEVAHQYKTSSGKVDVALSKSMQVKVFVEIKKCSVNLNDTKPQDQIKRYLNDEDGVELGILTNAISWIFFARSPKSKIDIIKVAEVNVRIDDDSQINKVFSNYLSKDKVLNLG